MNKLFLYTGLEIKRQFRRRNLLIFALVLLLSYYFIRKGICITSVEDGSRISPLAVWTYGFANMQLLIASLLSLLAGFRIFRFREFNKFLYTVLNRRLFLLNVLFSGIFPFFIFLAIHEIVAIIMLRLNGFSFDGKDQLHFLIQAGMIFSVSLLFYLTGVIAGSIKRKGRPFIVGLVIWFALVFIIPGAVHEIQSIHNYTTAGTYNIHENDRNQTNFSQFISTLSLSTFYQEAIENFNKRNELPKYFWTGAWLRLLYAFIMLYIIQFRWNRFLFHGGDKSFTLLKKLHLSLKPGERLVLVSRDDQLIGQIYSALCGKTKGDKPLIKIDGKDIAKDSDLLNGRDFLYICHPDRFPGDIRTEHFVHFLAEFLRLGINDRAKISIKLDMEKNGKIRLKNLPNNVKLDLALMILFSQMSDIYMVEDLLKHQSQPAIQTFSEESRKLIDKGHYFLYITGNSYQQLEFADRVAYLLNDPAFST